MRLSELFPRARPVTLGGRTFGVLPLRLKDVAQLEAFAAAEAEGRYRQRLAELEAADRLPARGPYRRALRETYLALKGAASGTASVEALDGPALVHFVAVALSASNVEIDVPGLARVVRDATAEELADLARAAWDVSPLTELERRIAHEIDLAPDDDETDDDDDGQIEDDDGPQWGEIVVELANKTGWDFATIGELRLPQLRAYQSGGKRRPYGVPEAFDLDWSARRERFFAGELDDEDERATDDGR